MKYAWIEQQRAAYPLSELCEVLGVSISGYRAWRRGGKPDSTRLGEPQAVALIKAIHSEVKGAYGSRRMHRELKGRGHRIGLSRVERLMREHGVRARHKKRYKATTDSKHSLPVADNVLARNFTPDAPNRVWSGDITYWTVLSSPTRPWQRSGRYPGEGLAGSRCWRFFRARGPTRMPGKMS